VLSILSPAKTLDYETAPITKKSTKPLFVDDAASLVHRAREMDPEDIQALMGVSEKIATLNHERFMNWEPDFSLKNAKQSVLAFKGDVYTGLQADTQYGRVGLRAEAPADTVRLVRLIAAPRSDAALPAGDGSPF
jgi:cytoplasmic iron level regulating protein YaaA (DUF328/UPF0246 family)